MTYDINYIIFLNEIKTFLFEIQKINKFRNVCLTQLIDFSLAYFKRRCSVIIEESAKNLSTLRLLNAFKIMIERNLNNLVEQSNEQIEISFFNLFLIDEISDNEIEESKMDINDWFDQYLYIDLIYFLTNKILLLIRQEYKHNENCSLFTLFMYENYRIANYITKEDRMLNLIYVQSENIYLLGYNKQYYNSIFSLETRITSECKQITNNIMIISENICCVLLNFLFCTSVIENELFLPNLLSMIKTTKFLSEGFNKYKEVKFNIKNYKNSYIYLSLQENIKDDFEHDKVKKRK